VGAGAGRLPRDLVGIVDGYGGEEYGYDGTTCEELNLTGHTDIYKTGLAIRASNRNSRIKTQL